MGRNTAPIWLAKDEFEERSAVFHQHRDHVVGTDPARDEPPGDATDAVIEGGIGNILAGIFQRAAIRRAPGMKGDEAGEINHSPLARTAFGLVSSRHEL